MNWYLLVVFVHVVGSFLFVLSHGVSITMALRLRRERDPVRIAALLELSEVSIWGVYAGLLILLVSGIAAGFMGGWWGRLWIWISLAMLVGLVVAMYFLGTTFYTRVRHAVGIKGYTDKKDAPMPEPATPEALAVLLASSRPFVLAAVGGGSLLILLWLMYYKPF